MPRFRLFLVTAFSCWIAICGAQCSVIKGKLAALKPEDDFKKTTDAYKKAGSPETKIQLWRDFLKRNPNNQYTIFAVDYVTRHYFLEEKKDSDGAEKFALEHLANLKDEKLKRRADPTLIRLYGKTGNQARLRELAAQIEKRRGFTLDDCTALGEAALKAKDWEFATIQGEHLIAMNTPQTIRAQEGMDKLSDEEVAKNVDRNRGRALIFMGQAALELNDPKTASGHFGNAARVAQHEYSGLLSWPCQDLNLYWAKALLKSGNAQAAMEKIAVEAAILGDRAALEVLQEALRAAGGKENLQQYLDRIRPRIAKTMPAFSVYDYDKKKVEWSELKGQVTLLTFWFPT